MFGKICSKMYRKTLLYSWGRRKFITSFICEFCTSSHDFKYIKTGLSATYNPQEVEECSPTGYFEPPLQPAHRFSIILPPPNITGSLHLGHALTATIEDVIVRWHRMRGFQTVWVPGIDHAGIATQVVVEIKLWKERGLSRYDLGREEFEKEIWKWKNDKTSEIHQQLRRLGTTLDWSMETFTMDKAQSHAVQKAFIRLFEEGLIYRRDYLINWSCVLQSAISDIEVEHLEVKGPTELNVPGYDRSVEFGVLTKFAYKLKESDDEIVVGTTRPETMLGDVAVAVNPNDDRYSSFIGKKVWHPFRKEEIPIIADEFVDPSFGTGAVKVTPAHDPVDFEVGHRHNLPVLQIIDEKGNLNETCGLFSGLPRFKARSVVTDQLNRLNLLRGREDHEMTVPICSRSKDVIEFLVKPQWFLNCQQMAQKAADAVRNKRLIIEPSHFEKTWFTWLDNIRDWCISRQLWWGHRIPAYLCYSYNNQENKCWIAAEDRDKARAKAAEKCLVQPEDVVVNQDEDVLDTWFSSSLLPFSVFGWPQKNEDLKMYYPLSIMETGHDILFFWVARMVMLGIQLTGEIPFPKILLHGVVCDAHGKKMSKSLGNVIAPEEVIEGASLNELEHKSRVSHERGVLSEDEMVRAIDGQRKMFPAGIPACGADALRFTLCSHNIKSHFINFDVNECYTNRLFCNKLWQATKFTKHWIEKVLDVQQSTNKTSLTPMDKWILSRLTFMMEIISKGLNNYDFHLATAALKDFLYYEFCDIYLESTKRGLKEVQSVAAVSHCLVLARCLDISFRALAPFMPHLSQCLHQHLPLERVAIPRDLRFPEELSCRDRVLEEDVKTAMNAVVAIRRLKKLFGVSKKHGAEVRIVTQEPLFSKFLVVIGDLSGTEKIEVTEESYSKGRDFVSDSVGSEAIIEMSLPSERRKGLDFDVQKLDSKRKKLLKELEKIEKMTSSESYKISAPLKVQQAHLKKRATLEEDLARVDYIKNMVAKLA